MKIRGREIKFLRTAKTTADLADLCPNGDIAKLPTVFKTGKYSEIVENSAKFIHIMHKGYEMNLKLNDKDYVPDVLEEDELMYLDEGTFGQLLNEAIEAYSDVKTTVEVESSKKKDNQ